MFLELVIVKYISPKSFNCTKFNLSLIEWLFVCLKIKFHCNSFTYQYNRLNETQFTKNILKKKATKKQNANGLVSTISTAVTFVNHIPFVQYTYIGYKQSYKTPDEKDFMMFKFLTDRKDFKSNEFLKLSIIFRILHFLVFSIIYQT